VDRVKSAGRRNGPQMPKRRLYLVVLDAARKNVVAYVALFVALGGVAYGAASLPPASVGTVQIKDGAITNAKVRRHSLKSGVFAPGVLPRLRTRTVYAPANPPACGGSGCAPSPAGTSNTETARCSSGQRVVGGGFSLGPSSSGDEVVSASEPLANGEGWTVTFTLTANGPYPVGEVSAICAAGS
jgi:hypothetical protein